MMLPSPPTTRWNGASGASDGSLIILVVSCVLSVALIPAAAAQGAAAERIYVEGSREIIVESGPFVLAAGASHDEVEQPATAVLAFPLSANLHGYEVELIDGDGEPLPDHVLHHMNLIVPEKRELFSNIMLRIGAAGPETGKVRLPRLLGFRMERGDSLLVTAMFHNPYPTTFEGVRMRVRLHYTPANGWLRPIGIKPFYVDVMPPAGRHAFDVPPGRSETYWEGSPAVPGRILMLSGHLHAHGVVLRFEDRTAGKVLWEGRPRFDEAGRVESMPARRFFLRLGLPLRPDHVYRLTAIYDNPTGEVIPEGGMGALGGVFIPARGTRWPEVDPSHPQYLLDVEVVHGGHGHHIERSREGHQHHTDRGNHH